MLINFPAQEEGAETFEVYMSWSDLDEFLSLPQRDRRLNDRTCELIRSYLGASKFDSYASHFGLPTSSLFFNIVPLIVNAAATIVPLIDSYTKKLSTESKAFAILFSDMPHANMTNPDINCGPFVLPS